MTAAELASHFEDRRSQGSQWRAVCPAHSTKDRCLSIKDGDDGGVVLCCFKSCDNASVLQRVGLTFRDIMPPQTREQSYRRAPRSVSRDDVRAALRAAASEYRAHHRIDPELRLTNADANAVRRTVSARLGVNLPPKPRSIADSWTAGRERDPWWPMLLERAWREVWIVADGREPCCPIERFTAHGELGFELLERAERLAANELRGFAQVREASSAR